MGNKMVDCNKCSHNTVCAFNVQMDKFKERIGEIEPESVTRALFYVEVKCKYFDEKVESPNLYINQLREQLRTQYTYGNGPFFKG